MFFWLGGVDWVYMWPKVKRESKNSSIEARNESPKIAIFGKKFFVKNFLRGVIDVERRAEARGALLGFRGGRWGCKSAAAAAAAAADFPKRLTRNS